MATMVVDCDVCGARLPVSEKHFGKRVRCPTCGHDVSVEGGEPPALSKPTRTKRRSRKRRRKVPGSNALLLTFVAVGLIVIPLVCWWLGRGHLTAERIGVLCRSAGLILMVGGVVAVFAEAVKDGGGTAGLCLILPGYIIYFLVTRLDALRNQGFAIAGGLLLLFAGIMVSGSDLVAQSDHRGPGGRGLTPEQEAHHRQAMQEAERWHQQQWAEMQRRQQEFMRDAVQSMPAPSPLSPMTLPQRPSHPTRQPLEPVPIRPSWTYGNVAPPSRSPGGPAKNPGF